MHVFASLGTDHHQFDRLVEWLDDWVASHPGSTLVLQHGASRPSLVGINHELLPHPELLAAMRKADVVVLQGGPGGVVDARRVGVRPIVVPRDPARGEVVDGHQFAFATRLASAELVEVATTKEQLHDLLTSTAMGERNWRIVADTDVPQGVRTIMERHRRLPDRTTDRWRRLGQAWRPRRAP